MEAGSSYNRAGVLLSFLREASCEGAVRYTVRSADELEICVGYEDLLMMTYIRPSGSLVWTLLGSPVQRDATRWINLLVLYAWTSKQLSSVAPCVGGASLF